METQFKAPAELEDRALDAARGGVDQLQMRAAATQTTASSQRLDPAASKGIIAVLIG